MWSPTRRRGASHEQLLQVLLRMLRREKLYAAINIAGLSLGIACCLILGLFLRSELTYDQHYPEVQEHLPPGERIHHRRHQRQVCGHLAGHRPDAEGGVPGGRAWTTCASRATPTGAASPSATATTSSTGKTATSSVDNVFELFPPKVIYGDPKTALQGAGLHRGQRDLRPQVFRQRESDGRDHHHGWRRRAEDHAWCSRTSRRTRT